MFERNPARFHGMVGLGLALLITIGLWAALPGQWAWPGWLGTWLAAVNLVTAGYYGYDKMQAKRQGRRVPELVLHGLALIGGSIGAYLAMQLFRHKTIKGPFRIVFWLIVLLQMGLVVWVVLELR